MIIDFHTHVFPDKIADKTIEFLENEGNIKAYTRGTADELKASMKENNINVSVVLPVVTKPNQFDTIHSFAQELNGKEGIISFGGIHPASENYLEELNKIKAAGIPGIKLHPDYQKTFIDDPKLVRIIQYAVELGLIVVVHAGLDIGLPDPIHCPPKRAAGMLELVENENAKIVLAHMGGYVMWEEVEEHLVGKNVYLDTSYTRLKITTDQFVRIVKNHGADRVLFGSDSPWDGQGEAFQQVIGMDLTKEEKDRILYRNAAELLGFTV